MANDPDQDKLAEEWGALAGDDDGGDDQDKLAAEWGALAEDDDAAGGDADGGDDLDMDASAFGARALNQDEIDSLLGFNDSNADDDVDGLHALVNSTLVSYERLPMLEIVFDRLVRTLSTALRNLTSDNVEVSLENIRSVRFGDYLNSIPLPAMISVFKAEEWGDYGVCTLDSAMIYSVVDVLLGGRKTMSTMRVEGRPYTTIERNIVTRLVRTILSEMEQAFAPLSPIHFNAERLETNPRFATIVRPSNAAALIELRVEMEERGGKVEIAFPYSTLEPIRDLLLQMFLGEKFGQDNIWETHFETELKATTIEVEAVLDRIQLSLADVLSWKPGSQILLNANPDSDVELLTGGVPLLVGRMGRRKEKVAIRVERTARPPLAVEAESEE
mgnify:CR=1 FL=1